MDVHEQAPSVAVRKAAIAGEPYTVRASATLQAFAAHWPRSDHMGEAACHVFQCADLIEVWLDTVGKIRGTQPVFVGLFDSAGEPVLMLGLGIERRMGVRMLTFLDGAVSDYNQPVLFPAAASLDAATWAPIWQAIVRAIPPFDFAVFDKVPASCGTMPNPLMHLAAVPIDEAGHSMTLAGPEAELEARLPNRKVRTRMLKQLSAIGPVALKVASTEAESEAFLQAVMAGKARQFERTGVPGFDHIGTAAFYHAATRRLRRPAPVHVSVLMVGDAIVACHWGLILQDRFYLLLTAYSQDWKRFSPGALLHNALIRWCHARGLTCFDFGIGNEAYKAEYCETRIPLFRIEIPHSPAGRAHLAASRMLARLRETRLWQRMRPLKWAIIRRLRV